MAGSAIIHETATVSPEAQVGAGTTIWHHTQVREGARIGADCILGKNVYVDFDVWIGDRVKVQNNASLYHPLVIEDGVFVGPHVVFTNDRWPRAINPDGTLKSAADWSPVQTRVRYGASIGAGAILLPGITIGRWAMVGAGAVVTKDIRERAIVVGSPATEIGLACDCAHRLVIAAHEHRCPSCGRRYGMATIRARPARDTP